MRIALVLLVIVLLLATATVLRRRFAAAVPQPGPLAGDPPTKPTGPEATK